MTPKTGTPLVAKLQTAPDAAWGPLLDQIDDARDSYDPVTQMGTHPLQTGESTTYRATSSGGTPALSAETDGNSKDAPVPTKPDPQEIHAYRAISSGGSARFPDGDDGSKHL